LTAAGQTLVGHADALLARLEAAEADLEATAERLTGTVRVATFQSAGLYLLAPALRRLSAQHPALRVEVSDGEPEDTLPALALGALDLVLGDEYPLLPRPPDDRLDFEPLLTEQFRIMLAAGHPLADDPGPIPLAALRDDPWAIGKADTHYAELAVHACRALGGFEPDVRHRSTDLMLLLALVANGQAVTLLPDLVHAEREPAVAVRDIAEGALLRTVFSAIRRGSERRPALSALRAALREAAGPRSAATPARGSPPAPPPP
jgi:DNA-binding transcriptional LysR family regulator